MVCGAQMFVFFPEDEKVGVKTIKSFAERMRSDAVSRAIMVVAAPMTPFAKQCLNEMQPKYLIEVVSVLKSPLVKQSLENLQTKYFCEVRGVLGALC